ncbi:MAG TPA: hypothetical protein VFZ09_37170 [Archangium sp.]|uniref:hypothetical protein n=1 Tax=Archangium sp. TaxID=1872627 RepID=UPI002E36E49F|nr:hypothetical protein [Archangium sp.]HEX5751912.1 hypothetical protein [Archangium sp.]
MSPGPSSSLWMPSFLHGAYSSVQRKTRKEGLRCGEQYREDGSFPVPRQMLEVPSGEVVVAHEGVDFQRERPAWRLYLLSNLKQGLWEALDWPGTYEVDDLYEATCRETAWGALYFAMGRTAPMSAERVALRLQAVLRFWEPLQSVRYLFSSPTAALTLEEVMRASCDWAMDAWCPEGDSSVRACLDAAAERMGRASREDSLEAILRQMPRVLTFARGLKHQEVVADPSFQRQRFSLLDPHAFERVSGACTSELLGQVYAWDRQLGAV